MVGELRVVLIELPSWLGKPEENVLHSLWAKQ